MGDFEPRVPTNLVVNKVTRGKHSYAATGPNPLIRSNTAPARSYSSAQSGPVHGVSTASRMRADGKEWRQNSAAPMAWRSEATSAMAGPPPFILRKTRVETMVDNPPWDASKSSPMTMGGGGKMKPTRSSLPPYDALSDPAMADYWARKFGWTVAGASGPSRRRTGSVRDEDHDGGIVEYKVEVLTSSKYPAPTGGTKCIELIGPRGSTGEMPLEKLGQTRRRQFAAGGVDTFMLAGRDVGTPNQIRLVNKSDARIHGWHCSSVTVTVLSTGKKVMFVVNGWLSIYEGDCSLELTRAVSTQGKGSSRYLVKIKTGSVQRTRCTSRVCVTLFGAGEKSSGMVRLVNNTPSFEGGHTDVFTITTPRIGKLTRMIIEHDGSGDSPEWFLEEVEVTHIGTGSTYIFHAGMWLAANRGDGRISRELVALASASSWSGTPGAGAVGGKCELLVEVWTGDVKYAGTEAQVWLQVFGANGSSAGPIHLRKEGSHSPFERGAHASFVIETDDVGSIQRIRIGHDNAGRSPGWFLKQVRIKHLGTGDWYTFPCERWLDRDRDDGQISREIFSDAVAGKLGAYAANPYHVFITTSSQRNAGTNANVVAELIGTTGRTGKFPLENHPQNFSRGRTDEFVVPTSDVGELTGMTLEHDNTGSGPDWLVEKVAVACPSRGKMYHANVNEWLTTDDSLNPKAVTNTTIAFDPSNVKAFTPKGTWVCSTVTADKSGASTSAKVFIQVYGENGKSDVIPLYNHAHRFEDHFKRGAVDKFQIELESLGALRKLRVWHDNSGGVMGASWALDKIVLQHVDSGAEYVFPCDGWLSHHEGDGEIVRELPATGAAITHPLPVKKYTVRTFTGTKNHAGTDANVHVVLYGSLGDTGPRELRKSATHWNKFEPGNEDVFTIEAVDLGVLERVVIGHDNRGLGASWYLDRVTAQVEGDDAPAVEFPCRRWLAKNEDDGAIERTLYSSASNTKSIVYQISVFTGDVHNAGTDANVHIILFGDHGRDSGKIELRNSLSHGDKFERGRTDVFRVEAADLGKLQKIRIGHDNSGFGASWFLDRVEVEVPSSASKFTFNCGRWLSKSDDDKQIERELLVDKEEVTTDPASVATYECHVFTADVRNAGTDAKVFITMYGNDGKKTDEMRITNNTDNFERGQHDTFRLECEDVGPPLKLAVRHDNSGMGPSWCLSRIEMHNLKTNLIYTFSPPVSTESEGSDDSAAEGLWLTKEKGLSADLTVAKVERLTESGTREEVEKEDFQRDAQLTKYRVLVHTLDEPDAGTDANVFIVVIGTLGSSGERPLSKVTQVKGGDNYHRDKFERGNTDEFEFDCVNLGELLKVQVRHDNRGLNASWLLGSVDVLDGTKTYHFPCNKWLAKTKGDKLLQRELPVQTPDDQFKGGTLQGTVTRYNVRVYTSDLRNAGTDANVHIVIVGESGDTGKVKLLTSAEHKDKFERGQVDSFVVDAVGLGEIKRIHIGHDDSGIGSDWHCERVEISVPQEGKEYVFECNRWFGKKREDGLIERVLTPTKSWDTVRKVPYEVQICTSDLDDAGTTAKVAMTVYGKDVVTDETITCDIDFTDEATGSGFLSRGRGVKEGVPPDTTQKELDDFGEPFKLVVALDPGAKRSRASWHLDRVILVNKLTHTRYEFPCNKWLAADKAKDGGLLTRSLEIGTISSFDEDTKSRITRAGTLNLERKVYLVKVTTGDIYQAGTDAKVYVTLFGDNGDSGERHLSKATQVENDEHVTHSDLFERGHTDVFRVDDVDLGELSKISVRHDNSSWKSSWFLDSVEVHLEGSSKVWRFPCSQWFSKKKGDKQISRELPALVDPAYLTKLEQDAQAAVDRAHAELEALEASREHDARSREVCEDKRREVLALQQRLNDVKQQHSEQVAGVQTRGELVTYEITVKTGDKPKAVGTPVTLSVELMGHTAKSSRARSGGGGGGAAGGGGGGKGGRGRGRGGGGGMAASESAQSSHVVPTSTGRLTLPSKPLTRGEATVFTVQGVDIGELVELRIGHDDKSPSAAWYLENVAVRISRPKQGIDPFTYHFPCSSWLSTSSTWKTLIAESASDNATQGDSGSDTQSATSSRGHTYRIEVLTGDVDKAGTDARVSLVLTGVLGESPELKLRESTTFSDKFERGHTDVFVFNDVEDLGKLTQVRVWHDNHGLGPSWFLEHITVFDQTTESKFEFPCNKWLSRTDDDHLTERVLPCAEYVMNGYVVAYDIEVMTSPESRACTATPIIKLVGDDRSTDELPLPLPSSGKLKPGEPVKYTRDLPALGNILEVQVRLPAPQTVEGAAGVWDLEYVKVTERRLGTVWEFPCDRSVPYGGQHVTLRQSAVQAHAADPDQAGELVTYEVTTVTSNIRSAGTDANVFVTLWGRLDGTVTTTGKRALLRSETHRDKFERGNEDVFKIEAVDLGRLEKVRVEHDASGWKNSDWHLDCVKVTDPRSGEEVVFPCGQWISKRRDSKELWRELFPKIADA